MEFRTLLYEEPENGIGLITLNRPDKLNAINLEMLKDFHRLYEYLVERHKEVRVLILTGAGRGFCAGADLSNQLEYSQNKDLYGDPTAFLANVQKLYANMILEMRRLPQPIIAAVKGPAAGGGMSFALASDVVYATPDAYFVPSFINIGLSGGELGTSYFLPKAVGAHRAREILMTGRKVMAEEAERIGLANRMVPPEALMETAMATARIMLTKSPMGLRQTKEVVDRNLDAPSLETAIELENRNQTICAFATDFVKAIEAFTKK